ncbi:DUF2145 domain-containing protein [Aquabacterium sp.]|uniref:DUF2145 domain-containing protein n=1 Tax=Aquabacterium sp. TaxID=1872578 RepID=UPI0039C88569
MRCGGLRSLAGLACLLLALLQAPTAQAGRHCEASVVSLEQIRQGMGLAERVSRALDVSGAQVVLLARMGQDLSKYQQRYSHMGWAYKTPEGWRVVHKLNECGTDHGDVYRQGLAQFFLDNLYRYEAAYVVPTPEVQARMLSLLKDNRQVAQLHQRAYSMLAYPWAQRYQQSNQWALESLALAMEPGANSRDKAQAWLRLKSYEPVELKISALTRLGARVTRANIAFDDHPDELRYSSRIRTTTVDSVFAWLSQRGMGSAVIAVH